MLPTTAARARPDEPDADAEQALRCRTVWISDLHLGTPGCQARALLDFLRRVDCETLYLVGDIIDGWQLRRSWYWPQAHNDVVQKVLRKARKGTRVVFVPGNHDEFLRRYAEHTFGGVEVVHEAVHLTADGRRLWVTHGDLFDGVVQCAPWLAHVGDQLYEFALKLKVKRAVSYVTDFEMAVAREARKRGVDGVVCGHIHHAEIRSIDGVLYCNDGDWVESLTALVEQADGQLQRLDWPTPERVALPEPAVPASPALLPA